MVLRLRGCEMAEVAGSLSARVAELESRCLAAEDKVAFVRATLLVNLSREGLDEMTSRAALASLLKMFFGDEVPAPGGGA